MFAILPAFVLIAAAVSVPIAEERSTGPTDRAVIQFRLAQSEPSPGLTRMDWNGWAFYLHPEILMSATEIAAADVGSNWYSGQPVVHLELTDTGRARLARITTDHVGDKLAILIDGELVMAPNIMEPIVDGRVEISSSIALSDVVTLARRLGPPKTEPGRSLAQHLLDRLLDRLIGAL